MGRNQFTLDQIITDLIVLWAFDHLPLRPMKGSATWILVQIGC